MTLERKAPYVWIAVAFFAACISGCALEGADAAPEATASGSAELQQQTQTQALTARPLAVDVPGEVRRVRERPPIVRPAGVVPIPLEAPTLPSPGGDTNDDPRPHPWEPQPAGDNGQADPGTGTSGASK